MTKILYNVTVSIDVNTEEEWKNWMLDEHIPAMIKTGMFEEYRMTKIISGEHENGVTYAIQYVALSQAHLDQYKKLHAPIIEQKHKQKFINRFADFSTTMEIISQSK